MKLEDAVCPQDRILDIYTEPYNKHLYSKSFNNVSEMINTNCVVFLYEENIPDVFG